MNRVRLRPHHVAIVRSYRNTDPAEREANTPMLSQVFGADFPTMLFRFVDSLSNDTVVEVVSTKDSLCETTGCPYREGCAAGDYRTVQTTMIARMPAGTPADVLDTLRNSDPEREDKKACEALGLRLGSTYRLKELCEPNESSTTPK